MSRLKRTASSKRFSWPLGFYRVAGSSMQPAFAHGDLLLGWRWSGPRLGRVVVVRHGLPVVKRVTAMSEQGIWLEGDNSAVSTDSRSFGYIDSGLVEAVIIWPRRRV